MLNGLGKSVLNMTMALALPSVFAAPIMGSADTTDVTLGERTSSFIAFSQQNPANGNTTGFSSSFESMGLGNWNFVGSTDSQNGASFDYNGFKIDFAQLTNDKVGTWTVTNTDLKHDATLDLVMAIHASNASTAFLFDNQFVAAGQKMQGTWAIGWLNNGGNIPAFSNVAFFNRDMSLKTTPSTDPGKPANDVPEPGPIALIGLGLATMMLLRKRARPISVSSPSRP